MPNHNYLLPISLIHWNDSNCVQLMSIIVQKDATIHSFIIFLQTALHVSDILIHHQEYTQTVITTIGTGRTRPVPDAVIAVWACSWWWTRVSSETCRAVCRNIIKLCIVASCWTIIDTDSRCTNPWTQNRVRLLCRITISMTDHGFSVNCRISCNSDLVSRIRTAYPNGTSSISRCTINNR